MSQIQFGQDAVLQALLDLGGKAKAGDIADKIEITYGKSRAKTVSISLNRQRKWGLVSTDISGVWQITKEGYAYLQKSSKQEPDLIESKVYDAKQRKYIVTLKA